MGTDIHGVFQRHDKTTGQWRDIPSQYNEDRHYQLFAVLAGVRNGTGFAGTPTGEAVTPIAAPRGYPEGFEVFEDVHPIESFDVLSPWRASYCDPDEDKEVWMGDHTHSWLAGEEMITWADNAPTVVQTGVISREEFAAWDKTTRPDSYCSGVSGPGVRVIAEAEVGKTAAPWSHVQVTWESSLAKELAYFFDEVRRLQSEHGEIRYVFGFDS